MSSYDMIFVYVAMGMVVATFATIIAMKIDLPELPKFSTYIKLVPFVLSCCLWTYAVINFYKGEAETALLSLILMKLYMGDKL